MIDSDEELPDCWTEKILSDVAEINPSVSVDKNIENAYVPMDAVGAKTKEIERYERKTNLYSGLSHFEVGDIIIAKITPCFENGKIAKVEKLPEGHRNAVGSSEFVVIRPRDSVHRDYLFTYLQSPHVKQWGESRLLGATGRERIKASQFRNELHVPIPPLDEQERLVEAVETRLDRINRLETSVDNIGRLSNEYENSYISFLSSGINAKSEKGIEGVPSEERVPNDWSVVGLSEVAEINPRVSYDDQDEYAYVPMDAVSAETQSVARFDHRDGLYSGLAKFESGDLIQARITPCFENGKIAPVQNIPEGYDFAVGSTEFVVIRPKDINREFLYTYLRSPIVKQWGENRLIGSTGRERIQISQFRNELEVPLPPKHKQQAIVKKIQETDFEEVNRAVGDLDRRFEEYRESILATAFTGDLDYEQ